MCCTVHYTLHYNAHCNVHYVVVYGLQCKSKDNAIFRTLITLELGTFTNSNILYESFIVATSNVFRNVKALLIILHQEQKCISSSVKNSGEGAGGLPLLPPPL